MQIKEAWKPFESFRGPGAESLKRDVRAYGLAVLDAAREVHINDCFCGEEDMGGEVCGYHTLRAEITKED